MKKVITTLFFSMLGVGTFAQWTPTTVKRDVEGSFTSESYYKLDLNKIRNDLKNAQETGTNAKAVEILVPTLKGKLEKFAVYSFPVMAKDLADQYELGSYVGVGIDDPSKQIRFSVAPNDFQAMVIKDGIYEFIDPLASDKTIYAVHPKTNNTHGKSFVCSTEEGSQMAEQIEKLAEKGNFFSNQSNNYAKSSDRKYRTMRLAISATSSYVSYTGGTLATALAQINATMTRVNGVFEKDFALHLNIINAPGIIFVNSATDPYLTLPGSLNSKVQQVLTTNVGDANYDIGHVFNAAGNNGNAGCVGCVCIAPTSSAPLGKGSGFTQSTAPSGDAFDIDYVAHEMGHQLGANHTFSYSIEGSGVNMEPGSGSTIMGYAGITNANVQMNSDAYFHVASIVQVQQNLNAKSCDTEVLVANNPPVIAALPTYTIPKGTAFVLTASATDPENDPLTYTWEQFDDAGAIVNGQITGGTITSANLGNTTYGASFRSLMPSTSPTRYFPKLSSVLNGVLSSGSQWESVSNVARTSRFAVTVRDNNPNSDQQQTQSALQIINVGNNGPFKINTQFANITAPTPIQWDVAGTTAAPYSVANVKIDYTTDNGNTWTLLAASTANDGSENFTFPASMNGQVIKVRVSSIGNVFYAIKAVTVTQFGNCGSAPTGITTANITSSSADVYWVPVAGASSYVVRYKKVADASWLIINTNNNSVVLPNLLDNTAYEVQVAAVCSGVTGSFSSSSNFNTTPMATYCPVSSGNASDDYISNVTLANVNNSSSASTYTSYVANPSLQINLNAGASYTLSVSRAYLSSPGGPYPAATSAWIDFNRNGVFEASERILTSPVANGTPNPVTISFTVPANAVQGLGLRMRVGMLYSTSAGISLIDGCGNYINNLGEFEDYNVVISAGALSTNENTTKNAEISIFPNPATDVLNITKVSDKAKYEIYNAVGQLVKVGEIKGNQVRVNELVKGTYIIIIKDKEISGNFKFIKK
ncbi:reprolysin-like metallopeptidase [Chryseobacterium echinoideorum]|uniref:reprolysin-like metallopeptidase n=1 Tax=Chryseobacterium echinoideorum TaxID=1549648 RepID=UPI00118533A8|nr:zinc-dependent metalloprotease family protein [Chryseobacterium echinoideorum]